MSELSPSILAANFNRLGADIKAVEDESIDMLHVDVMDGMFVPSISFGMPVIESIRKESNMFFDVHLMVEEPLRYIKEFVDAGADGITVHVEACEDLKKTIDEIKKHGVKTAVAVNPATDIERVYDVLDDLDMVLVMSVNPGFGGQKLMPETLGKVKKLVKEREKRSLKFKIEMDGGINSKNIEEVVAAGVDVIVAGTAVFSGDISNNIKHLKEVL